jgi:hypothetical protein
MKCRSAADAATGMGVSGTFSWVFIVFTETL